LSTISFLFLRNDQLSIKPLVYLCIIIM